MGMTTMKTLATALGVSVTTVSNAYNHPDRLSAELRAKILAMGDELGYCGPNAAGRLLRSGKSHAIGALCGSSYSYAFADSYALAVFRGLSAGLESAGIALSLLPTGADESNADAVSSAVVDGIVCMTSFTKSPAVEVARRRGLTIVYNHIVEGGDYVAIDDHLAGSLISEHLAALGHTRVAILYQDGFTGPMGLQPGSALDAIIAEFDDDQGHFMGTRLRGMAAPFDRDQLHIARVREQDFRDGDSVVDQLLALPEPPTAILTSSDRFGLLVLDELESLGLVPGQDISVASIDGVPEAIARGLTTVSQPMDERGPLLASLVLDPELAHRQVVLPISFVPGTSTGPVRR